jgi:O-methyltransferase domain
VTTTERPTGAPTGAPTMADHQTLLRLQTGPWTGQALYAAAKLGVADHLTDGARTVADLAGACGADAGALYRILRALSMIGIFAEVRPREFALNSTAELLRSDHPMTHRHFVIMHGEEIFRAFGDIVAAVRSGQPVFSELYGASYFDYLATNEEASTKFNAAMGKGGLPPAVARRLDLSDVATVVDVGGGIGVLLGDLLRHSPHLRGVLFDRPAALADARSDLREGDLAARCELVGGDFFESVPQGGDAYVLCHVLHDWSDEDCVRILRNVRRAMPTGGRLLVFEWLLADGFDPRKLSDLVMLVILGGRERTAEEFTALLTSAGFAVTAIHKAEPGGNPGPGSEDCIEAVATEMDE